MEQLNSEQMINDVLSEAAAIVNPTWYHYSIFKQRLERNGVYSVETVKRLAYALRL